MNLKMQRRAESFNRIIVFFFCLFFIWIALQFLAPFMVPTATITDISGSVFIDDTDEQQLSFPWNGIYATGDILCHQKVERTIMFNGNQMPFCSRCTAIWIGLVIGLGAMIFYRIPLDEKFIVLMVLCMIPIAIDGLGQLVQLWESSTASRIITGLLIGTICGIGIGIIVDEVYEIRLLKKSKSN